MLKSNSSDSFLLNATATPLPWTEGGPNQNNNQQQPTASHITVHIPDPIFTIKNRVANELNAAPSTISRGNTHL